MREKNKTVALQFDFNVKMLSLFGMLSIIVKAYPI